MGTITMRTTLERRGPAAAIVLTDEQVAGLGPGKVFPVRVTIGDRTAEARVARMGGENLVGLSKDRRAALDVEIGDVVKVVIELDEGPREVSVPEELAAALAENPEAKAAFDRLPPSHRKEHARAVADAKRPETKARRVAAAIDGLLNR